MQGRCFVSAHDYYLQVAGLAALEKENDEMMMQLAMHQANYTDDLKQVNDTI